MPTITLSEVYKQGYLMINNLDNESIVIEIRELISDINSVKQEVDIYCELVKQIILSGSCNN